MKDAVINALMRRLAHLRRAGLPAMRRGGVPLAAAAVLLTRLLLAALEVVMALVILFEEWGWRWLSDVLGWLGRWRLWAAVETWIIGLPPYAALVVFALPTLLLLPLKFLALLLIAGDHLAAAGLLFLAAKLVATALVARLFLLTQPALMRIGWFAWAYAWVMPWKEALVARVHASWVWRIARLYKARILQRISAQWVRWRPVTFALRGWGRTAAGKAYARGRGRFGAARRWLRSSR